MIVHSTSTRPLNVFGVIQLVRLNQDLSSHSLIREPVHFATFILVPRVCAVMGWSGSRTSHIGLSHL